MNTPIISFTNALPRRLLLRHHYYYYYYYYYCPIPYFIIYRCLYYHQTIPLFIYYACLLFHYDIICCYPFSFILFIIFTSLLLLYRIRYYTYTRSMFINTRYAYASRCRWYHAQPLSLYRHATPVRIRTATMPRRLPRYYFFYDDISPTIRRHVHATISLFSHYCPKSPITGRSLLFFILPRPPLSFIISILPLFHYYTPHTTIISISIFVTFHHSLIPHRLFRIITAMPSLPVMSPFIIHCLMISSYHIITNIVFYRLILSPRRRHAGRKITSQPFIVWRLHHEYLIRLLAAAISHLYADMFYRRFFDAISPMTYHAAITLRYHHAIFWCATNIWHH